LTYEYEEDTRRAYRDLQKARDYQKIHTQEDLWARFASWRERRLVEKLLAGCALAPERRILDVPCGTGILGGVLREFPNPVVAADISLEMMDLARTEYGYSRLLGFVQADITQMPFAPGGFACMVILGLMHRLPAEIRMKVLVEIASLRPRYVIITYSIYNLGQRFKQWLLKKIRPSYNPAPVPVRYEDIIKEVTSAGFKVSSAHSVFPLLSANVVLGLESRAFFE